MKKISLIKFSLLVLLLVFSTLIAGCKEDSDSSQTSVDTIDVSVTINYPSKSNQKDIIKQDFSIEKDTSVLDVLQLFCNVNDISANIDTTNSKVEGIGGVSNGDYDTNKTWQYKINGEKSKVNAPDKAVSDGDEIEWYYSK